MFKPLDHYMITPMQRDFVQDRKRYRAIQQTRELYLSGKLTAGQRRTIEQYLDRMYGFNVNFSYY